jgi:hypothetical protein
LGASAGTLEEEAKGLASPVELRPNAAVAADVEAEAAAAAEEEEDEVDDDEEEVDKTTPSEMLPSSAPGFPSLLSPPSLSASSPTGLKSAAVRETPPARTRVTSNHRHVSLTRLGSKPPSSAN